MRSRHLILAMIFGAFAATSSTAPGWAQIDVPGPGRVTSSSFTPVRNTLAISVRPVDDSPDNVRLKSNFESALSTRRWRVSPTNAPLRLEFETEYQPLGSRIPGTSRLTRPGPITEPEGAFRRGTQTENTVIIGDPADGRGGLRYVLTVSIRDAASGQPLWQGEASYDGVPSDEQAVMRAMIPILLDRVGKTVRREPFKIN